MKLLSDRSYLALLKRSTAAEHEVALASERSKRLVVRCRDLERQLTEIKLDLGIRGMSVELKPPVPAQPGRLVIRKIRER